MPQLSLTDLVDIVSRSGTPKATKVAQVKQRPDYEPAFDFYLALREAIIDIHRRQGDKRQFSNFMTSVTDRKKLSNYPSAVNGYKKWWGRKELVWFAPPRALYARHGIEVIVNPELGLEFNSGKHVIKLYFKQEALSKLRVDVITQLMEMTLRSQCAATETMSVMDVRNAKLFSYDPAVSDVKAIIDAELAYIAALWSGV